MRFISAALSGLLLASRRPRRKPARSPAVTRSMILTSNRATALRPHSVILGDHESPGESRSPRRRHRVAFTPSARIAVRSLELVQAA